jgi:hypothetical protein
LAVVVHVGRFQFNHRQSVQFIGIEPVIVLIGKTVVIFLKFTGFLPFFLLGNTTEQQENKGDRTEGNFPNIFHAKIEEQVF